MGKVGVLDGPLEHVGVVAGEVEIAVVRMVAELALPASCCCAPAGFGKIPPPRGGGGCSSQVPGGGGGAAVPPRGALEKWGERDMWAAHPEGGHIP